MSSWSLPWGLPTGRNAGTRTGRNGAVSGSPNGESGAGRDWRRTTNDHDHRCHRQPDDRDSGRQYRIHPVRARTRRPESTIAVIGMGPRRPSSGSWAETFRRQRNAVSQAIPRQVTGLADMRDPTRRADWTGPRSPCVLPNLPGSEELRDARAGQTPRTGAVFGFRWHRSLASGESTGSVCG